MKLFNNTYPKLNDEELMVQSARGSKAAFAELYKRYAGRLDYYFSCMFNFDKLKAADYTHDLFLKIIENGESFDKTKKLSTWIYSIAANMCKNEFRRLEHEKTYIKCETLNFPVHHDFTEEQIDYNFASQELISIMEKLSPEVRELLLLRFREELTIKEIAQISNLPEGTVKSKIFYSLKSITIKMAHYDLKNQQ
jgi:RNA polymerase sigma-70 factor (ECF subfamily)